MRKLLTILFVAICAQLSAQPSTAHSEYMKQRRQAMSAFNSDRVSAYRSFIAERNEAFAKYLAQKWGTYEKVSGEKPPIKPYPLEPIVKGDVDIKTPPIKFPIKEIITIPTPKPIAPEFVPPIKEAEPKATFEFEFIGAKVAIGLTDSNRITLQSTSEGSISNMWRKLSNGSMSEVVRDCLYWKEKMQLNDYFYVLMVDAMCNSFFEKAQSNEARLMKSYILAQSGYDAKCGRKGNNLIVLLSIDEDIYGKTYLIVDGRKYYIIDEPEGGERQYNTFAQRFSNASKSCSMQIGQDIVHPFNGGANKRFTSERYPSLGIDVAVDQNLIAAYNNYPQCSWGIYAKAPMSSQLSKTLYPKIRSEIVNKSELDAANIILNFVQTAFDYKTDKANFGYERSLFVDETFHYPYCDCEDRSILFANLVKNILGLDVVLLHYPNHLATAVQFKGECSGDYVMVRNKKYIICDPTYIGAEVGNAMPECKRVNAKVIRL